MLPQIPIMISINIISKCAPPELAKELALFRSTKQDE